MRPSIREEAGQGRRPLQHGPKIAIAVAELKAEGKLLPGVRKVERDKLIRDRLVVLGYGADLPSRSAIDRFFEMRRQSGRNGPSRDALGEAGHIDNT